jgi:hypothetical protein
MYVWTGRRILFIFSVRELVNTGRCSVIKNILVYEIGSFQMSPQKQNGDFLGNVSNIFD